MVPIVDLFRQEPRARVFFGVLAQSSLGTGAGYIALLLIAYERFDSPWAIRLVLLADLLPAMLLGPVFGAAADRWSRRWLRGASRTSSARWRSSGIALVDGFVATVALALLAGVGTGLFTPAALAALPSLVAEKRLPAATSAVRRDRRPRLHRRARARRVVLIFAAPETIAARQRDHLRRLGARARRRCASARRPARDAEAEPPGSLLREARDGLRASAGMAGVRIVLVASAGALVLRRRSSTSPSCRSRATTSAPATPASRCSPRSSGSASSSARCAARRAATARCSSGATCWACC